MAQINQTSSAIIRQITGGFVVVSAKFIPANATTGAAAYFDEEENFYATVDLATAAITTLFTS